MTGAVVEILVTLLTALFGGAGAVLLWEGVLKPRREVKKVARVLAAELTLNKLLLIAHRGARKADPHGLPADFRLTRTGFDAIGDRIAELPVDLLIPTLLIYQRVDALNRVESAYGTQHKLWEATASGTAEHREAALKLESILSVFDRGLAVAIEEANKLQPLLCEAGAIGRRPKGATKFSLVDFEEEAAEFVRQRKGLPPEE